ncbi:hypothetical protein [Desulfocicer vacuolatum]|uniref:hypothetical protein n=1 Tax=Desulfocicer vacuolatum TaxID=2298 RepID=UPI001BAEE3C9|nr:hypothetical protein [Desulfocicer vacuolatum]
MKYSADQGCISSFVVGRAGSEYGSPVAVIQKEPARLTLFRTSLWTNRGAI